jgi:hypothetical protein
MTSALPTKFPIKSSSSFHMIGLFIDPLNPTLREFCSQFMKRRQERMEYIVKGLNRLGFTISPEDCLKMSGGENIGRPHIVKALKSNPINLPVMEKLINNYKEDCLKNPSLQIICSQAFQSSIPDIWNLSYGLFLQKDCYYKGVYINEGMPPLEECAKLIHDAGGITILAHYFTLAKTVPVSIIEEWMFVLFYYFFILFYSGKKVI